MIFFTQANATEPGRLTNRRRVLPLSALVDALRGVMLEPMSSIDIIPDDCGVVPGIVGTWETSDPAVVWTLLRFDLDGTLVANALLADGTFAVAQFTYRIERLLSESSGGGTKVVVETSGIETYRDGVRSPPLMDWEPRSELYVLRDSGSLEAFGVDEIDVNSPGVILVRSGRLVIDIGTNGRPTMVSPHRWADVKRPEIRSD